VADIYVHARLGSETYASGAVTLLSLNDGTRDAIWLNYDRGAQTLAALYWNGTTSVTIDTISIDMSANAHDVDVHAVVNSGSGSCDVYIAGTRRIHGTGLALSGTTSIVKVRQYGANFSPQLSQCVASTTSTIGGKVFTVPVNGAGSTSSWTGTYANIDETVYSDLDFINSGTANQVSTFSVNAPDADRICRSGGGGNGSRQSRIGRAAEPEARPSLGWNRLPRLNQVTGRWLRGLRGDLGD
jgi:hypothetical protein